MLGHMNAEALARTLAGGRVTFLEPQPAAVVGEGRDLGAHPRAARAPRSTATPTRCWSRPSPRGPTRHTGAPSCFFRPVGEPPAPRPSAVFEQVFAGDLRAQGRARDDQPRRQELRPRPARRRRAEDRRQAGRGGRRAGRGAGRGPTATTSPARPPTLLFHALVGLAHRRRRRSPTSPPSSRAAWAAAASTRRPPAPAALAADDPDGPPAVRADTDGRRVRRTPHSGPPGGGALRRPRPGTRGGPRPWRCGYAGRAAGSERPRVVSLRLPHRSDPDGCGGRVSARGRHPAARPGQHRRDQCLAGARREVGPRRACARRRQGLPAGARSAMDSEPGDLPDPPSALSPAAGLAATLGHIFPVYLGFRGGKGVACALGVFAALLPLAGSASPRSSTCRPSPSPACPRSARSRPVTAAALHILITDTPPAYKRTGRRDRRACISGPAPRQPPRARPARADPRPDYACAARQDPHALRRRPAR